MSKRQSGKLVFFFIILLTAISAFFIYPQSSFSKKFLPWRLGLDLVGGSHLAYQVDMTNIESGDRDAVLNGLRDVIEKRVNLFGVSEPTVVTAKNGGLYRIIVDLAGRDVTAAIKEIGDTPTLIFAEVGEDPNDKEKTVFTPTELTGRYVESAQVIFGGQVGQPQISLVFDDEGAKLFEAITEKNIGKPLAVFLDNNLITAPTVQEKITGGKAQITGQFTIPEAKQLVERFNAGALPAPITLINQQTVGASLGTASLNKIIKAGLAGVGIVMLFMILYYRHLGIFSALALLIYTALALAVFKLFSVTMSLSGIAGFILSVGMAVDANILIFERSKEEMKKGMSRVAAVEEGFRRAWLAIRDSNVTTIITTLILYNFSSGFVKGFALTLMIGVVISMFSAISATRAMLRVFVKDKNNPLVTSH